MAAGGKGLSPEERVAAALVPASEQPFEVPQNWCWTRLGAITNVIGGGTPSTRVPEYYEDGTIPWISPADLSGYANVYISHGAKNITELGLLKSSARLLPKGTVCLTTRAPIGYVAIAKNELSTNQGFKSFLPSDCFLSEFLFWYLKANTELLKSRASGTTFLELSGKQAGLLEFPLPPLAEQRRIVERIESLFAKLDETEARLRKLADDSERREVSVLHRAFDGELTSAWRESQSIDRDSWETKTLESVCSSIFDGDHMPPPKAEAGVPFLVISNVNTGNLSFEDTRFVPKEYYDGLSGTRKPEVGDVLYTLVGSYGIPVVVDDERPFCFQRHMALLKPSGIETRFLWHLLRSRDMYDKATAIATGTAQLTVPIRGLRKLEFECPGRLEREEIARQLDVVMSREKDVRTSIDDVLAVIATLRQAILAKAMRGELGTNDPDDPDAELLLEQMFAR